MSVYKEAYILVNQISKASKRLYPDAADYGVPVKINDPLWNFTKQVVDWHRREGTKNEVERYSTGYTGTAQIQVMDEWRYSDAEGSLSESDVTENFKFTFVTFPNGDRYKKEGYYGFLYVEKVR